MPKRFAETVVRKVELLVLEGSGGAEEGRWTLFIDGPEAQNAMKTHEINDQIEILWAITSDPQGTNVATLLKCLVDLAKEGQSIKNLLRFAATTRSEFEKKTQKKR